jgi:hypothetical protein
MSNELNHGQQQGNGGYERQDLGAAGVLYFLAGLAVAGLLVYFVVNGLFSLLQSRSQSQQPAVNPLVTEVPRDTRKLPAEYNGNYEEYLKKNFPAPQLEINERSQLNDIRLKEEQTLSTYGYIDEKAGSVRIPIDRAMDLIAQRGLPVRAQASSSQVPAQSATSEVRVAPQVEAQPLGKKGTKK